MSYASSDMIGRLFPVFVLIAFAIAIAAVAIRIDDGDQ